MPALSKLTGKLTNRIAAFLPALAETRCTVCLEPMLRPAGGNVRLCQQCRQALARKTSGFCTCCGEFFASTQISGLCMACQQKPRPWGNMYFHAAYTGLLRDLIHQLKFGGRLHLAVALGCLLAEHPAFNPSDLAHTGFKQPSADQSSFSPPSADQISLSQPALGQTGRHHPNDQTPLGQPNYKQSALALPAFGQAGYHKPSLAQDGIAHAPGYDCITPIPLHMSRLSQRGFNQSAEIARPLAARLGIPICSGLLTRNTATRRQSGLTRKERAQNLRGVFTAPPLHGQRILLLDDIMTTGATLHEAATCLLKAGAAAVDIAVIARTPARNMCAEL